MGEHPDPSAGRLGCPDHDTDGDGVFDAADQCPAQPQGMQPDPARVGCPRPTATATAFPICRITARINRVRRRPIRRATAAPVWCGCRAPSWILTPVYFATNRDVILARSFPVLTAVADALRASPQIHRVSVEGHTDDAGNDDRNLELSRRRALSVQRWLVEHGIEADRLEAQGFGESAPCP